MTTFYLTFLLFLTGYGAFRLGYDVSNFVFKKLLAKKGSQ